MESSLYAILSITLTPCKSMEGGLMFQGHLYSFHTGVKDSIQTELFIVAANKEKWFISNNGIMVNMNV